MSDVQPKQFKVLCGKCEAPAEVDFWPGFAYEGGGDTGHLILKCPNCGITEQVEE